MVRCVPHRLAHARLSLARLTIAIACLLGAGPLIAQEDFANLDGSPLDWGPPRELESVDEIRRLSVVEANEGRPARILGVITYRDTEQHMMFVSDESGGLYVQPEVPNSKVNEELRAGMLVEIKGTTFAGGYSPSIQRGADIRVLGAADFPKPLYPRRNQLVDPKFDSQWIEIEATATAAEIEGDRLKLKLSIDGRHYDAFVSGEDWEQQGVPPNLVDSDIRIRGVYGSKFNDRRQLMGMRLFVPGMEEIEIIDPGFENAFSQPPRDVTDVMRFNPNQDRIHVSGTVLANLHGEGLFVRSVGGAIRVRPLLDLPIPVGQRIDVVGFPDPGKVRPVLQDAAIRYGRIEKQPDPIGLDASTLDNTLLNGELVKVEARVVDHFHRPYDSLIVLELADGRVYARVPHGGEPLQESSWVSVTGICILEPERGTPRVVAVPASGSGSQVDDPIVRYSVSLIVREDADIQVLQVPSWWTPIRIFAAVSALAVIAFSAFVWGVILRRKVRQQTLLIESKIEREKIAEERARIARDLHDSLEQELVGITIQLDAVASRLDNAPQRAKDSLDRAREMLRRTQAETRRSVWDLRAPSVTGGELRTALNEMIANLWRSDGPQIQIVVSPDLAPMSGRTANHLFRIAQEAVTNAIKHSKASSIRVDLEEIAGELTLRVSDNGIGFDAGNCPNAQDGHFGVSGMKERAGKLQGSLEFESAPALGTQVLLNVPISMIQGQQTT